MPSTRRPRVEPTDDWPQRQLLSRFPEQRAYELLQPVVLFGHAPAERARQTGAPERTLYRQAARFETHGMASLFTPVPAQRRAMELCARRESLDAGLPLERVAGSQARRTSVARSLSPTTTADLENGRW